MQRRTASYCAFAKWDLQYTIFTPRPSEIHTMRISAVAAYAHFVFKDTSRAGYGLELTASYFVFEKWDLE